jgi:hypothetical protein
MPPRGVAALWEMIPKLEIDKIIKIEDGEGLETEILSV